ncbi:hypothetical protein IGI04_038845 [Brassica rapa subsp. trilocularis]|uniref:Uncharacterized protein n=1 Tax=Brassica rapa subsp. trilocularis TaxID=1813537 RepID=A0ABQ7LLF4_BRACM|nr:hypothetical protein IGI04_038845 [Brassica rapa subsp. trilocularis]
MSGFINGISGGVMVAVVCDEQSMPFILQKLQGMKESFSRRYNKCGFRMLSDEGSLEEGALVSSGCLFYLWSFLQGVLALVWYRERMVQVCLVRCCCVGHYSAYSLLCLVGSWQECRLFL